MKRVIILLLLAGPLLAQQRTNTPREALYQALDIYSMGRYEQAYQKFKSLAEFYAIDGHHTIFRFMAAKCLYKAGRYEQAQTEFERFIRDFPSSSYISPAYLYLGHIAYQDGLLLESAIDYLKAIDSDHNTEGGAIAAANLSAMLNSELSIEDLAYLADNYPRSEFAGEIIYSLGKRHYAEKRYKRAVKIFEKYLENYAPGDHGAEVKQLYAEARELAFKNVIISVLAPLSGSYADYGKSLVDGITLVFEESPHIAGKEIELMIKDTRGSPVYATLAVKALVQEEPAVIIGPLRSESAVGAATVAANNKIPLITPTASENGIADLGECIYQISPPAEKIATSLAEYAVTELGIKDFSIIAPGDFTGRQISRAFSQKVYQLGGEVLTNSFYEDGETDFSNQIKTLRDVLLMRTEEQLATGLKDSTEYYDFDKEEWLDQEDWRVYLGGLFLPGYPRELSLLVPQIRYHVITTQYLGLDGWDSPELVSEIKRYIKGAIFATDYHPGTEGDAWEKFHEKYRAKFGKEPDRIAALAYDAASLVKLALESGASSADEINDFLGSVENYQGAACEINFQATGHANNATRIYQFGDGSLTRLK